MKLTVQIAATAISLAIGAGSANAFDLKQLDQIGIHVPDASSPFLCDARPADDYFQQFNCPVMAEAFWTGEYGPVQKFPKAVVAKYLQSFVTTVHAPDLTYKVGAQVHAQLDPNLPIVIDNSSPTAPPMISRSAGIK